MCKMNGATLTHILEHDLFTKKIFCGLSAPDLKIPKDVNKPALFILNTDISTGVGEHWCGLLIFNNEVLEFFDSFGYTPYHYNFHMMLKNLNLKYYIFNNIQVQDKKAATCGHHCIFWAYHKARGVKDIEKMYKKTPEINDRMVYNFVSNTFGSLFALV